MEFHLDYSLQLQTETEFKNLYSWVINEIDESSKVIGRDYIPWLWDVYFTATEIVLSDEVTVREEVEAELLSLSQKAEVVHRRTIRAKLFPGVPDQNEDWSHQTTFRMFGTNRVINDFRLDIHPLRAEEETETCRAWGSVSYTAETDFKAETLEDCIIFYLMVKPSTFDHYAARISADTADEVILRVGTVAGFYSHWSPSISTSYVKVLTRGKEQELQLPADFELKPPRLGSVGEAALNINARRVQAKKLPRAIDHEAADADEHQHTSLVRPEAAIAPAGIDPQTIELMRSLKRPAYWIIGMLGVLVITTLLKH